MQGQTTPAERVSLDLFFRIFWDKTKNYTSAEELEMLHYIQELLNGLNQPLEISENLKSILKDNYPSEQTIKSLVDYLAQKYELSTAKKMDKQLLLDYLLSEFNKNLKRTGQEDFRGIPRQGRMHAWRDAVQTLNYMFEIWFEPYVRRGAKTLHDVIQEIPLSRSISFNPPQTFLRTLGGPPDNGPGSPSLSFKSNLSSVNM